MARLPGFLHNRMVWTLLQKGSPTVMGRTAGHCPEEILAPYSHYMSYIQYYSDADCIGTLLRNAF